MISLRKYLKLLAFSMLSLLAYFSIDNSAKINSVLKMITESKSSKALGIYILLILGKHFLLLFGVLGLTMFFYRIVKDKDS